MKYLLAAAALLGMGLAPVAHAQASCGDINTLIRHALGDFDAIAAKEIEEDLYETSYGLSGAEDCRIDYAWDSAYSCMWVFDTLSEVNAAYDAQLATVGSCLASWTRLDAAGAGEASGGYRTLKSQTFTGRGDHEDLEWTVAMEEHVFDGGQDWHVWLDVVYLW